MKKRITWIFLILPVFLFGLFFLFPEFFSSGMSYTRSDEIIKTITNKKLAAPILPPLDTVAYDKKLNEIANNPPDPIVYTTVKTVEKDQNGKDVTKITKVPLDPQPVKSHLWPVKTVYPNAGAILPFKRIIAYYGNLYSTKMGVLGQYPQD